MNSIIKKWRDERKLTQAAAGALVGVTQPTWAKWEDGQVPPEQCLTVHGATGIALHELRPDIYPVPQRRASDRRGIKA
jgi:DNA-binding transcriptional regulator YdaS (Cro superfamily)